MCLSDAHLMKRVSDRVIAECIEREKHYGADYELCNNCVMQDVANYYAEERQGRAEYLEGLRNDD